MQKAAEAAKEAAKEAAEKASRALSQVCIHSSCSESSVALDTLEAEGGQGAKEEDMEISSQETVVAAGGSQDDDFGPTPQTP